MNKILSFTIAVIVIIISAEAGYYWGIKTSPQPQPLTKQVISTNKSSSVNLMDQLAPAPTSSIDSQKLISQKTLELSKIIKNGNKKVLSGDLKSAIQDLVRVSTLKSEINRINQKTTYQDYYAALLSAPIINDVPDDNKLKVELTTELKKIDFNSIDSAPSTNLAKTFYKLGLVAHQNNHKELVLPFWISMVNLSPEWSHFQLELANYYLFTGNTQTAKNTIDYCSNFHFPATICDSFLLNEIQNNQPHPIGFMEDRIKTEVIDN